MTARGDENSDAIDSTSDDRGLPGGRGAGEGSDPNDSDGQMNDQRMPTADGEMSSNSSEEVTPPPA